MRMELFRKQNQAFSFDRALPSAAHKKSGVGTSFKKNAALVVTVTLSLFLSYAESFRVHKLIPVYISDSAQEAQTIRIGVNDAIALFMPQNTEFIEGIEIKMQIPAAVSEWRDSVACSLYEKLKPAPSAKQIDYSGAKTFVTTLPDKLSWIMQIPLHAQSSLKDSQYLSKIGVIPDISDGHIFIRFQPAMKGMPDQALNATLELAVKPIFINKGKLQVSIEAPDGRKDGYRMLLDGVQAQLPPDGLLLDVGTHTLSIQSEEYRNETRSLRIEQARTAKLIVALKSLTPTLFVTAPDNAEIFLNDAPFHKSASPVAVPEGDYTLRVLIGGYEIIRTLAIQKGKSYTANLAVDLKITEE